MQTAQLLFLIKKGFITGKIKYLLGFSTLTKKRTGLLVNSLTSKKYSNMVAVSLKNITIKQKEDKNFNKYYLIVDNDSDSAYFCFERAVKSSWEDLIRSN